MVFLPLPLTLLSSLLCGDGGDDDDDDDDDDGDGTVPNLDLWPTLPRSLLALAALSLCGLGMQAGRRASMHVCPFCACCVVFERLISLRPTHLCVCELYLGAAKTTNR